MQDVQETFRQQNTNPERERDSHPRSRGHAGTISAIVNVRGGDGKSTSSHMGHITVLWPRRAAPTVQYASAKDVAAIYREGL